MLQSPNHQTVSHAQIVSTLTRLCQEWQEATEGESLLETHGNIGLVLADLIDGFKLSTVDQRQILGTELFNELTAFLSDKQ